MITVEHRTKRDGSHTAVPDVSFRCAPGTVTGFLGPNGAGKSTTLRMVCGLTTPSAGTATVRGVRFAELPNPGRRVGVLLDVSAQHAGRSGRESLALSSATVGVDRGRVDALLERVGLAGPADERILGTALSSSVAALDGAEAWLDAVRTLSPLLEGGADAAAWARVAASAAWLVGAPLAVGAVRVAQRDGG